MLVVLVVVQTVALCCWLSFFFFFKQKTAYEMRISDWSCDVCSSDLHRDRAMQRVLERHDDDGAPLPELRELGVLRKVTPVELTDAWRGRNPRFHFRG